MPHFLHTSHQTDFHRAPAVRARSSRIIQFLLAFCLCIASLGMEQTGKPVSAATRIVTSTANSGPGTLRQAIADAAPHGDTITFSLTSPASILLSSEIVIDKDITISGPGAAKLTISGSFTTRIFNVSSGKLRLSNLTLANAIMYGQSASGPNPGTYSGTGGAVFINSGAKVTATNVIFNNNSAWGGSGANSGYDNGYYGGAGGGAGGVTSASGDFGGGGGGAYEFLAGGSGGYGGGGGGSCGSNAGGNGGGSYADESLGGAGGSGAGGQAGFAGGGGGAGMGGAVFISAGGALGLKDVTLSNNKAAGGSGGSAATFFGGGGGGGGAGLGSAIFNGGDLCIQSGVTFSSNTVTAGAAGSGQCGFGNYGQPGPCPTPAQPGRAVDTSAGIFAVPGSGQSCTVWFNPPTDLILTPAALYENKPVGTLAGTLSSVDIDAAETFTYSLITGTGSTNNSLFRISGNRLETNALLDFEAQANYSVRIQTTDKDGMTFEKSFSITILNANDPPTGINLSASSINENIAANSTVGVLSSIDQDANDTHTYALVNPGGVCSGVDNASFSINGQNLRASAMLNYEAKSSYTICIRTTDNGGLSHHQQFTIQVLDINEPPTNLMLSNISVPENEPSGATVGTLTALDPDINDTHTFSLVTNLGCLGTHNANFTIEGAILKTNRPLDHEMEGQQLVCVRATDKGGLFFNKQFTIEVNDVNEAPKEIRLSGNKINENQLGGTVLGSILITDPDMGDTHTLSLVDTLACPGTDNASFSIIEDELTSVAVFDYETKDTYSICIRATDSGGLSLDERFSLLILDINEAPYGITIDRDSFPENQPIGTKVGALSALDPDGVDVHTFEFNNTDACPGIDNSAFLISEGELLTNVGFDYEVKNSFSICLRTIDSKGLSAVQELTISVTDVNEAPVSLVLSGNNVSENDITGTIVGGLIPTDPDKNDTHTYILTTVTGCSGAENENFFIEGTLLKTSKVLDYETQQSHTICIRTTDSGGLSYHKQFTIHVLDVNEAPTGLNLSSSSLQENRPAGTFIGDLTVTDPDADDYHALSLVSTPACAGVDNASFSISGSALTAAAMFDFEEKNSYSICIRATDAGGLVVENPFTINVLDVNEPPTDINLSNASIAENSPSSTLVGSITTDDPDTGDTHTYTLVNNHSCSGPDNSLFLIIENGLYSAYTYDYEEKSSYSICMRAVDSAADAFSLDKQFTISIIDVNEEPWLQYPIADQVFTAGYDFVFTFPEDQFGDPDGDWLIFSAEYNDGSPLPPWLVLNQALRKFSGAPIQAGIWRIRLTATDPDGLSISGLFDLEITAQPDNYSPVVMKPLPNAHALVGDPFSHTFDAASFADREDDPLTYLATLGDGLALPGWLSFSSSTRTFWGTPGPGDEGVFTIRVTALDARGGEVSSIFLLGVDHDLPPSVLNPIPHQTAARGEPWTFRFASNAFTVGISGSLVYTAELADGSPLPGWLKFSPDTRTFKGTLPDSSKLYFLRVRAANDAGSAEQIFRLGPWSHLAASSLPSGSMVTIDSVPGTGPSAAPKGVQRMNLTADVEIRYGIELITELVGNGMPVCFKPGPIEHNLTGGQLDRLVIGASHEGGAWKLLETYNASNGRICARTNHFSLFDVFLKPANITDATQLPRTGFAPGVVTPLSVQLTSEAYSSTTDVRLKIPALDVDAPVVGVPLVDGQWDVTWLWRNIGWLEGSAFPGLNGNSVLTGHVYDSSGLPGLFVNLADLHYGDEIIVFALGTKYVYQVRSVDTSVAPTNLRPLEHDEQPSLTLITCRGYNADQDTYRWRTVVRAALVGANYK
jgi:LPXTG-site transpeptidase (sortase) family protein